MKCIARSLVAADSRWRVPWRFRRGLDDGGPRRTDAGPGVFPVSFQGGLKYLHCCWADVGSCFCFCLLSGSVHVSRGLQKPQLCCYDTKNCKGMAFESLCSFWVEFFI